MDLTTRGNSNKTKYADTASTTGLMVNSMKVSGVITRCTDKEPSSGETRNATMESLLMTSARAEVHSAGPMGVNTSENGSQVSSMAVEPTSVQREFGSQASGKMERK